MKISVIIPFHNEIELIGRAVNSVISNCLPQIEFEIIICNDGDISSDNILERLDVSCRDVTKILRNVHSKGPGGARNTGLDASVGDFIAFLDADDVWLPGKLEAQLSQFAAGNTFVATAYRFDNGQSIVQAPMSIDRALDVFLQRGIGTSTVMITRGLLADMRFKNIRFAQDIDLWYALAQSPCFRYAAVQRCYVEYSTGGTTKSKWVQLQYVHKVLRINDLTWTQQIRVLLSYVFTGVYNHYIKRLFVL